MQLQTIIDAWNRQTDNANQWDNLSGEEMAEFVMNFMQARFLTHIASFDAIQYSPFDTSAPCTKVEFMASVWELYQEWCTAKNVVKLPDFEEAYHFVMEHGMPETEQKNERK